MKKISNKQTKKLLFGGWTIFSSFTVTNIDLKKKPKLIGNQVLLNGKTLSKQQAESSARKYLFAVCYDFSCTRIIISSVITRYISYTIYADQGTDKSKRDCGGHVRTFLMTYYYFDSVAGGGPRIQEFLIGKWVGGEGGVWFRKACCTFLWQITSHRDDHVFLNLWTPVDIGAASTALRAEANRS